MGISKSTLDRIIKSAEYRDFFTIDKTDKTIILHNDFHTKRGIPFIKLTKEEIYFLIRENDNLLCKYFLYLKYYCGIAKHNKTEQDFTAKQFLSAFGYSEKSNNYLDKISSYNKLLVERGYISIKKYRDELGHTRNIYITL
jgi:hypothetical protein